MIALVERNNMSDETGRRAVARFHLVAGQLVAGLHDILSGPSVPVPGSEKETGTTAEQDSIESVHSRPTLFG